LNAQAEFLNQMFLDQFCQSGYFGAVDLSGAGASTRASSRPSFLRKEWRAKIVSFLG